VGGNDASLVPTLQHLHGLEHGWGEAVPEVSANVSRTGKLTLRCRRGARDGKEVSGHPHKRGVDNAVVLPPLNHCCNALAGVKARRWRVGDFESLVLGWRAFCYGWGPGSLRGGSRL